MNKIIVNLIVAGLAAGCVSESTQESEPQTESAQAPGKPHILFISMDDMRPEVASYGADLAITPNIDALAAQGIKFTRAYAQQAICGPSRASIMTGVRPDTSGVTHNYIKFRQSMPNVLTLPEHFMQHGYNTTFVGKIYHHGDLDPQSWNWPANPKLLPPHVTLPPTYAIQANTELSLKNRKEMVAKYGEEAKYGLGRGPATEGADVPDYGYIDGYHTELGIATLGEMLKRSDKPIFFGFGMNKPHLPWIAPKKYWDLYNPEEIKLASQASAPKDGATMGLHASFELRTFYDVPNYGPIPSELAIKLKHAYLACASYVDAQIGRMIQAFKDEGILDNTIIVLWSDHGFHLGDKGIWGKATNYELATRVPFIISTPDMRQRGLSANSPALVELIDMYPTLSDLAGLSMPAHLEGQSLVELLKAPEREWKTAAFSQFPNSALREWGAYPLRKGMRETYFGRLIVDVEERIKEQFPKQWDRELFEKHLMGYSMRTERYRLISWQDTRDPSKAPLYVELYDHQTDPEETINIARQNPELVVKLLKQMGAGWKGNLAKVQYH